MISALVQRHAFEAFGFANPGTGNPVAEVRRPGSKILQWADGTATAARLISFDPPTNSNGAVTYSYSLTVSPSAGIDLAPLSGSGTPALPEPPFVHAELGNAGPGVFRAVEVVIEALAPDSAPSANTVEIEIVREGMANAKLLAATVNGGDAVRNYFEFQTEPTCDEIILRGKLMAGCRIWLAAFSIPV